MRFTIRVDPVRNGWSVEIRDESGQMLGDARSLPRLDFAPLPFPQPPAAEAAAIPNGELHKELCTTVDGKVLDDA